MIGEAVDLVSERSKEECSDSSDLEILTPRPKKRQRKSYLSITALLKIFPDATPASLCQLSEAYQGTPSSILKIVPKIKTTQLAKYFEMVENILPAEGAICAHRVPRSRSEIANKIQNDHRMQLVKQHHDGDMKEVMKDDGINSQKVLIRLFYRGSEHRVKIFRGTNAKELHFMIREMLHIRPDTPLAFTDEDGIRTFLTSACSDGTKIHLASPEAKNITGIPESSEWRQWALCSGGTLKEYRSLWIIDTDDPGFVIGKPLPRYGRHFATFSISNQHCCISMGIIEASRFALPSRASADVNLPHMFCLDGISDPHNKKTRLWPHGRTSSSPQASKMGVLVDMKKHEAFFFKYNPGQPVRSPIIRLTELPERVKFAVEHVKHGLEFKWLRKTVDISKINESGPICKKPKKFKEM